MEDGLENGVITCIHLENFVTFEKEILYPGEHLNVIVEYNGSGKSTIVAAIILGLGGKPNIIGQDLHVGEYVKFGCDSARIEIHLKNSIGQDSVVTLIITKEGESTWMINGNEVDAERIQDFTSKLNIQVDNLCQFLLQDKVKDFSNMDAQALLENTERSVGDPKLLEDHLKLKDQRTKLKALEVNIANIKQLLESKTRIRDRLQVLATIEERKLIKEKIVTLEQKKAWILYDQMWRKLVESMRNRDLAVRKMQTIEAELKSLNKKVEQMISEMKTLKNVFDDKKKKNEAKNTQLENILDNACSYAFRTERTRDQDMSISDINAPSTEHIKSLMGIYVLKRKANLPILQKYFNDISNAELIPKLESLILNLSKKVLEVKELEDKFTTAERTVKKHDEEFQLLKREAKRLYNEMLTNINISPQDDAFEALNKAFEILLSIETEKNNELNNDQANVFCMAENMDTETILQEYEEMQNNIQKLTELVKEQTGVLEEKTREIEKLKQTWLKLLEQLIKKINAYFSSYLFTMGCAGEVTLWHDENVLDFDQYGFKIKVKFGDADELQELTGHFQRGGERMMITTIYMLALQKLSRVPFRCVDEINQGMDTVNERRVFELLVKIAERPGSSQYFLFVPYLLPDVTFTKTMTVLRL